MGQYIQRHRRPILGLTFPVFFIFILVVVGFSIFPGWIHRTYGTPGDSCLAPINTLAFCFDSVPDPLFFRCDTCKGEFCSTFNATAEDGKCAVISGGTTTSNPAAVADPAFIPCGNPASKGLPACWTSCREILNDGSLEATCEMAACGPNDGFCKDPANACRVGTCQVSPTPDPLNPSGCDYQFKSGCTPSPSPEPSGEPSGQVPGTKSNGMGCSLIK